MPRSFVGRVANLCLVRLGGARTSSSTSLRMMLLWLSPGPRKAASRSAIVGLSQIRGSPPGRPRLWLGNEMRTSILGVIAAIGAFALFGVASPAEADVNITAVGSWGDNTPDTPFSQPGARLRSLSTLRIIRFPQIRQTKLPISLITEWHGGI